MGAFEVCLQGNLNDALFPFLGDLLEDYFKELPRGHALEVAPLPGLLYHLLVHHDVVDADFFQLLCVVLVSDQEDLEHVLLAELELKIAGANFHQSRNHEEISED